MRNLILTIIVLSAFVTKAQSPFTNFRTNLETENYSACDQVLDSCLLVKYHEDSVMYYRGFLILKKGNIKSARAVCKNLKKTYPDFTAMHYLSGLIYFVDEAYGNSIDEFTIVLKENPKHFKALYNRSIAYGLLEDFTGAISGLTSCISLDPKNAALYYSRAYWYEYTDKFDEAQKDYEESILLDPKNYDAYFGLAYVHKARKENEKACEVINKAISAGSQIAEDLKETFCK